MNKQDYFLLLNRIHPNFFKREDILNLPDEGIYEEMILALEEFEPGKYDKKLCDNISFGYYHGDVEKLKEKVERIDQNWSKFFQGKYRVYCGYIDGEVVSFCVIEDMGTHDISGHPYKIGGPGCVGTLPECRNKGIGLTMIKNVTQILKDEGYDYSYIHFTAVPSWYERLGYKSVLQWNNKGVL